MRSADRTGSIRDALCDLAAADLVDRTWPVITAEWVVIDPGEWDAAAFGTEAVGTTLHRVLVEGPTALAGSMAGLPDPAAAVIGHLAAGLVPLPGDALLAATARTIRVIGAVGGALTGHPLLVLSCVKSLVRTEVTDLIGQGLRDVLRPARPARVPRSADGEAEIVLRTQPPEIAGHGSAGACGWGSDMPAPAGRLAPPTGTSHQVLWRKFVHVSRVEWLPRRHSAALGW